MSRAIYLDPVTGEPTDTTAPAAPAPLGGVSQTQGTGDQGPDPADPGSPGPQGPPPPPPPANPAPMPSPPMPGAPPAAPTTPTSPTTPAGLSGNPNYFDGTDKGILDFVTDAGINVPQMNESVRRDPAYWTRRIKETGGLTQANYAYWWGRMLEPEGTHQEPGPTTPPGGPAPGGTSTTPGLDPSIADFFRTQTANLAAQQARDAEIRAIIRARLAAAGGPVDENSAEVAQPLSAARDEVTRSQDTERTALAERLYAQGGLNTGALGQQIQLSAERNAQGLAGVRSNLITHVADAKRAELMSLLQLATAQGDAESARAIQAQITAINASVTSQGQSISLAEFLASLNQQSALAGLNG